jgi:hypothetical protein
MIVHLCLLMHEYSQLLLSRCYGIILTLLLEHCSIQVKQLSQIDHTVTQWTLQHIRKSQSRNSILLPLLTPHFVLLHWTPMALPGNTSLCFFPSS